MDTKIFLSSPIFAKCFFNSLPIRYFNKNLKLNRDWYKECRRELEDRQKFYAKKYRDSQEEYEKSITIRERNYKNRSSLPIHQLQQDVKRSYELYDINYKNGTMLYNINQACIRCGFFDLLTEDSYFIRKKKQAMESTIVNKVIDTLRAVIKSALCQGFSKTNYLITNHIQYIKNIKAADNPERYISSIAKKLFPNEETFIKKSKYLKQKYRDDLLSKFEELYKLYYKIAQEALSQKKKTISEPEANEIIEDLLWDEPMSL